MMKFINNTDKTPRFRHELTQGERKIKYWKKLRKGETIEIDERNKAQMNYAIKSGLTEVTHEPEVKAVESKIADRKVETKMIRKKK